MKRVMWSGLLTAVGALASIITQRAAAQLWRRVFDEEPPGVSDAPYPPPGRRTPAGHRRSDNRGN